MYNKFLTCNAELLVCMNKDRSGSARAVGVNPSRLKRKREPGAIIKLRSSAQDIDRER